MIQAIETEYNGYRFRSRLEARWAVFFDTLGVKYEYEKEGYILDGVRYLPDFWLPHVGPRGIWVEIKGQKPTEDELKKAGLLCLNSKAPVLLYSQDPYWPVPSCVWMYFTKQEVMADARKLLKYINSQETELRAITREVEGDGAFTMTSIDPLVWTLSENSRVDLKHVTEETVFKLWLSKKDEHPLVAAAYKAARSARFEHGESPR